MKSIVSAGVLVWYSAFSFLEARQVIDTSQIRQWIDTAMNERYDAPDKADALARRAWQASQPDYYFGILNSLQILGETFYTKGLLDSALVYYYKALRCSQSEKDPSESGNNFTGLATLYLERGDPDSSLHYYDQAIRTFEALNDSSALSDALLRLGNVYNDLGNHDQALSLYMRSLRISEALHREDYIAYNYSAIGVINDKQGNYQKAEEYFFKAKDHFRASGNLYGQIGAINNLGILYKNMKDYRKSMDAYQECLRLADSLDYGRAQLSAHTNLGILSVQTGNLENALQHSETGLQLATKYQDKEAIADNLNWMARAQLGLGDDNKALQNAQESLRLGKEVQSLEKQRDANLTLSEIYQALGAYDLSLSSYKAYTTAKDSLYNAEKSKQINELQTIYETEKKDHQIEVLEKNAEIDRIRKTRLWIGLALILLAGILLMYAQRVRRIRDRKILSQQKELEIQRRKTAELEKDKVTRELDFKKQELAAKALRLARKNEFLQTLHDEVDKMRTTAEGHTADSARKISRQIRLDIESEEEWEHFLASFREVHRDFIDQLRQNYPALTKGEIRLACLMKMNLSAKELAAMLNVTGEGIKKARYRLRKKMQLDSDTDIQQFLLAFPGMREA